MHSNAWSAHKCPIYTAMSWSHQRQPESHLSLPLTPSNPLTNEHTCTSPNNTEATSSWAICQLESLGRKLHVDTKDWAPTWLSAQEQDWHGVIFTSPWGDTGDFCVTFKRLTCVCFVGLRRDFYETLNINIFKSHPYMTPHFTDSHYVIFKGGDKLHVLKIGKANFVILHILER